MNTFSSHASRNTCGPPEYYTSETHLHEYINRQSLLQHSLFDTELDCSSDVSVDSSSSFSLNSPQHLKWVLQENMNGSFHEDSESPKSCGWSDDNKSDFHQFDKNIRQGSQIMLDEAEERRYLAELVSQDMLAEELGLFYPEIIEESHFSLDGIMQDIQRDIFPTPRPKPVREKMLDNLRLSRANFLYKENFLNGYSDNTPVKANPNSDVTLRNPNSRCNNPNKPPVYIPRKQKSKKTIKAKKNCSNKSISREKGNKKQLKLYDDDKQRVFLGGLPIGITERKLRQQLATLGYKVLKRPKVLKGFAPEVWLKTADQANDLIAKGTIILDGSEVEVRPYNSLAKSSELKNLPNVGKRSVFISGFSTSTTTKHLRDVLSEMGMKVINSRVLKHGFVRQIILDTISQAKTLVKLRKIKIKGTFVDIRPFSNQKRRKRTKKRKLS